ncbi:MAG TPA: FumA C-terminus/TtdB family hydratase beta subunit [Candidatus Ozemobacteraceae bacterium]|nr:FumA C-terminus/TtdB family hydratase beta subunit [Candidatus Ozemobacteraceae bacterium]
MNKMIAKDTPMRKLEVPAGAIRVEAWQGREQLVVSPEALRILAAEAFHDVSFHLRARHLDMLATILDDPEASENDRYVAASLIRNAVIAAAGALPICQDTGTATVIAKRGGNVVVDGDDAEALTTGIAETYRRDALRYSQIAPLSMFDEVNTRSNLPPQIDIAWAPGNEYQFLFMAKGGGSANKTSLFQESKALLNDERLEAFLREKIEALGVAACPPYRLVAVIGGTSPEFNLKMLKLASAGALDQLPPAGTADGTPYRDRQWEERVMRIARSSGLGAQFGGRWLALEARVIRLPRHAGSCPVSVGVSCSADRNVLGRITADGVFLEELDHNPARLLPKIQRVAAAAAVPVDLNRPMAENQAALGGLRVGSLVLLSGPLVVARDIAHARLKQMLDDGKPLPEIFSKYPVYYAGPAKTPDGHVIGSFGPTTAQRMDSYVDAFMARGASLVMLAKGNRSPAVTAACRTHGGFYLGTIGGAAALIAKEHIVSSRVAAFEDLGMEAMFEIVVRDMPAFLLVDDKGASFYDTLRCR